MFLSCYLLRTTYVTFVYFAWDGIYVILGHVVLFWGFDLCCIVTNNYTYTYACRNIFNTIKTSGHSSLEKYTSHFIERVVCERELETEQMLQLLTPSSSGHRSASFLFSWAVQPGAWGPSLSAESWFPPLDLEHWLQARNSNYLTSCLSRLYHCFTPTQFNPSTVKAIPWYLRSDAPVIYTGTFLIWQLGRVGGQYATLGGYVYKELSHYWILSWYNHQILQAPSQKLIHFI